MFEGLRHNNIIPKIALVASGGIAVTGCAVTVEGVGNVPMVNCSSHASPRSNRETVRDLPKGTVIQLGEVVTYSGNTPTGDFQIESDGRGKFDVSINSGNNASGNDAEIVNNFSYGPDRVTVSDNGELFVVSGENGPQGSTSLSVDVSCS